MAFLRVLQVVTDMNIGGLETMLMNYYRNIDRSLVQFDFLEHRSYRSAYDDEIESLGGRIYRMPRLNPFSPSYRHTLGTFFDNHPEYKIVHVHQDCLSAVILMVARKHGVQVRIAHSHSSSQNKDIKYPVKLFFKRFIARNATELFACSNAAGDWMFNGAEYKVLNNAIDAKKYIFDSERRHQVRASLGLSDDEFVVGHVGRFSPPKNHDFLIDIFNEVQKRVPAKLILVGDGALRAGIETKAKELGIFDKTIFTGVRSDVADLLQAMDVFLFPSIYEGLPLTVVEAQAAGLPCLISDKVPIDCKKTDLVSQIALSDDETKWAEAVIAARSLERPNTFDVIRSSGFDIQENASWLANHYLKLEKRRVND